ncbi:MASE1 domain-containing protein [Dyella sp. 2HG41-7]|uniref:MASE1 domain-containing protein n=1 Tax=Dyella sp. 2HG41-7 TaxID=2883239 RepID=UPI001F272AF5|nr:MASE1 domain-containing protein [Dyella sp. 2HG41-7]
MLTSIANNKWLRQLAVFVAYTAAYLLLRPYSNGIWAITGGLRLSALVLLPYRYWPALILADTGPLIYDNIPCLPQYGLTWTICNSIPPILFAMPVVWWCRYKLAMFPSKRLVRANALLLCVALVSLVWTITTVAVLATVSPPSAAAHPYHIHKLEVVQVFLGKYAGILTVLPVVLVLKLQKSAPLRQRMLGWVRSQLTMESLVLLLPTLAVLFWVNHRASPDAQQVIRMAMFLPVAWLTVKHGWRAAAIGIAAVLSAIFMDLESRVGALDVLGTQAFVGFSATCLFALGARIAVQNAAEEQERLDAHTAVKLAQQGLYLCELRMRQAAQTLEQIGGTLQLTQARLLNRFKHMLPPIEGQTYYKQMASTQHQVHQLVESMHPIAWRERGLPAAMRETIGRSLDEANIAYRFDLKGRGLSQLSPGVHAAIYRLACEAAVHVFAQQACTTMTMTLRGGFTHGQRWAVLRICGSWDDAHAAPLVHTKQESQHLAAKLGANGLGLVAMRDFVRLYNGDLHSATENNQLRITALVHDVSQRAQGAFDKSPEPRELYIR